jgi:hypothetical protein
MICQADLTGNLNSQEEEEKDFKSVSVLSLQWRKWKEIGAICVFLRVNIMGHCVLQLGLYCVSQ